MKELYHEDQKSVLNSKLHEQLARGMTQAINKSSHFCLESHFPTAVFWGPEFYCYYNSSYLALLGIKHPFTVGKPACEVWPEIWEILQPHFQTVYESGSPFHSEDQLFYIYRSGYLEECYMSYSLSTLRDQNNIVEGILCTMIETTAKVLSERRINLLGDLAIETSLAQGTVNACLAISDVFSKYTTDLPFSLIYLNDRESGYMKFVSSSGYGIPGSDIPKTITLGEKNSSPFNFTAWPQELTEMSNLNGEIKQAVAIPIFSKDKEDVIAVIIIGVSPQLQFTESYRSFYQLLGRHLSATLMKKSGQEIERKRAENLALAAIEIYSPLSLNNRLQTITDQARDIIGAHQATTFIVIDEATDFSITTQSLSFRYKDWEDNNKIFSLMRIDKKTIRLSQEELKQNTLIFAASNLKGCLAVPILNHDGQCVGYIQLSDKYEGNFSESDEFTLQQIAQMASVAIINSKLLEKANSAVAARDEFIAIASHELKTPLQSLKLQLEMAKRNIRPELNLTPTPEQFTKVIDSSHFQVDRLTRLVEDLLDITSIQSGNLNLIFEPVNVNEIVHDVLSKYKQDFLGCKNTIELKTQQNLIANWNQSRIQQIFINLFSNILKYAPGTEVLLKVEKLEECILIELSDNGPGIPKEFHHKIFKRYERATDRKVSGLGLGLYIVREIINGHKGTIRVESEHGQGAKFVILLPIWP